MNPLAGKPLRYLIGADSAGPGEDGTITVVPYGDSMVRHGISVGYCNLFDEENEGKYGPYLKDTDTSREYGEGVIDPHGPGWKKNIEDQFRLRLWVQHFEYIELDNADAYSIADVIGAIDLAASYGLKVIAKNPGLLRPHDVEYVAHANIYGAIVERGHHDPDYMAGLRIKAGKPDFPVWFVAFGGGKSWANTVSRRIQQGGDKARNMGVTYSSIGEYRNSKDILRPRQ